MQRHTFARFLFSFLTLFRPFSGHPTVQPGTVALSGVQRKLLDLQLDEAFTVTPFRTQNSDIYLTGLQVSVDFLAKSKKGTYSLLLLISLASRR